MHYKSIFACLILFFFLSFNLKAQDTTVAVKKSWYVRSMPFSLGTSTIYSGTGVSIPGNNLIRDRTSQNIEVGVSTSIMDIGLAYGRLNFRQDSTAYLETRFTLVTCQIQKFSNEFIIGMGYSCASNYPIVLEAATTILLQVSKQAGVGLITGYYDFAGNIGDYSKNFYGLFFRFGLARSETGSLLRRKGLLHRHR
jgi:cytochrome c biogenesis protein CcdA